MNEQRDSETRPSIAQLFDLSGKGAIVTGGAIGIGQAIALRLAEAGAQVTIADIDLERARRTVEQIKSTGGKAQAVCADARIAADAAKVVQATVDAFGSLDILVNNAGVYPRGPALETSDEMWVNVINTNINGMFFYSRAAANQMVKAGHGGKIINLASVVAFYPADNSAPYTTSKGGVVALTKSLAKELALHGILVNAVAPGAILSPGVIALHESSGVGVEITASSDNVSKPLGRYGKPDDIARVVLFLASSAADFMTGSVVLADAGFLIK